MQSPNNNLNMTAAAAPERMPTTKAFRDKMATALGGARNLAWVLLELLRLPKPVATLIVGSLVGELLEMAEPAFFASMVPDTPEKRATHLLRGLFHARWTRKGTIELARGEGEWPESDAWRNLMLRFTLAASELSRHAATGTYYLRDDLERDGERRGYRDLLTAVVAYFHGQELFRDTLQGVFDCPRMAQYEMLNDEANKADNLKKADKRLEKAGKRAENAEQAVAARAYKRARDGLEQPAYLVREVSNPRFDAIGWDQSFAPPLPQERLQSIYRPSLFATAQIPTAQPVLPKAQPMHDQSAVMGVVNALRREATETDLQMQQLLQNMAALQTTSALLEEKLTLVEARNEGLGRENARLRNALESVHAQRRQAPGIGGKPLMHQQPRPVDSDGDVSVSMDDAQLAAGLMSLSQPE